MTKFFHRSITLALLALLLAALPLAVGAQDNAGYPVNSITVTGSGTANGAPDVAYVQLGVDVANSNIGEAVAQANTDIAAVTSAIIALGVDAADIQTTNFNVYPEDRYDPNTGQPTGERIYRVQNTLQITVRDIARTAEVVQAGLNAGADSVYGLTFGIADTSALEQDARLKAIDNARARAEQLAAALGVTLGSPIIIVEGMGGGFFPPVPYAVAQAGGLGGSAPAPQITPGQLSVSVTVTITYAISG